MIRLRFMALNRALSDFSIENKVVMYTDKIWKKWVQFLPRDQNFVNKLLRANDKHLNEFGKLIIKETSGGELTSYNQCKTDEEVAELIRAGCQTKGLREIK